MSALLERAFEAARLMREPAVLPDDPPTDRIVGHSPSIREISKQIGRVAPLDVTVLILGESGTGKELVARAIYHHSKRADKPFLAINCAAIPEGWSKASCLAMTRRVHRCDAPTHRPIRADGRRHGISG